MFFWKFTRSGRISQKYISLILDFHDSNIKDNFLKLSFNSCEDLLCLMHDVEVINMKINSTAGLLKPAIASVVADMGFKTTNNYVSQRYKRELVLGKMVLGSHDGEPLEFGKSTKNDTDFVLLDINKLKINYTIPVDNGLLWGVEDKLKAFRNDADFINNGNYFDLMPMHICMLEIFDKMRTFNPTKAYSFAINILNWEPI